MSAYVLTLNEKKEWSDLLQKLPIDQQDIYYTPEYYELYEKNGDGKAMCFVFEKNDDIAIYPFLINSVNKTGYYLDAEFFDIQGAYGYNGIISSSYDLKFIKAFYKNFENFCYQNNIISEFTRFNPYIGNHKFSENYMQVLLNRQTVALYLDHTLEDIWKNSYSSKNRNMVRKSHKNGYRVTVDNSNEAVKKFYSIYLNTMKRIGADKYYYFSDNMFYEMAKHPNFYFLFAEDKNNEKLATMILMLYGKYAHYHLSGKNPEKGDNSVNNFLLDEAVKLAKGEGAEIFHFGGGNTLDTKDSLFRFKKEFSKMHLDFYIGKKIHNIAIYGKIVQQWKNNYPEAYNKHKNMLLGYRKN